MISKQLLGLTNLSGAYVLYIYEAIKINMIYENKYLIFETF